jgi:hypothetical protein
VRTPNLKIQEVDDLFAIVTLFISEVIELIFSSICVRKIATQNVFVISNSYPYKPHLRLWKEEPRIRLVFTLAACEESYRSAPIIKTNKELRGIGGKRDVY